MARKPWVEFEGAFYHVIVRGNQRQKVFRDDGSDVLPGASGALPATLPIYTPTCTQYYNRRYRTTGQLFQGRGTRRFSVTGTLTFWS